MSDIIPIRRALISVSDKTGLLRLAETLIEDGAEILSTGGSARALREAGIPVTEVSDHTGFPEILDGRVKTLVPQIHGGILGRRDNPAHLEQMAEHNIAPIDLVVVNLYPFEATVARGADFATCVENIDIGGPALIRAAAKNHDFVAVLTSPADYDAYIDEVIEFEGRTTLDFRRKLAMQAFARTSAYDCAIARWFERETVSDFDREFSPDVFMLTGDFKKRLRYGENPHQHAQFYAIGTAYGVATAEQVQGKELSYNNFNDTDAAFECVAEFDNPAVVIVKHANPCGVAMPGSNRLEDAWDAALACDPVSAFGGIVALNGTLDEATATKIAAIFTEVIIAPDATEGAKRILSAKKNLRLLLTGGVPDPNQDATMVKSITGGLLVQSKDSGRPRVDQWKIVTKKNPTPEQMRDMIFAFQVAKHVKSNAIVYAKNLATIGIGAGQMNRVDSARIAGWKAEAAGLATTGCVVASDAFFPFADGLQAAIAAGATAVVQPGGSIRDAEVIAAADAAGITMLFTGRRHFRH